jgi:hypothetical protein
MKKSYKIIIVGIFALFMLRVCLSKEKKKEDNILLVTDNVISVNITPHFSSTLPINTAIFGVNIGFAFARELDKDSGFVQLLRDMHPSSLRFPGGTVANYYHPGLPVYGYKKDEIMPSLGGLYNLQTKRSENILYNYIRLCKQTGAKAIFCANVLTGTTEELLFVIAELKKNNIPILGVELGNEFCLMGYRKQFPDAATYIQKVKATALAIHSSYPDIRLAVVGGDGVAQNETDTRSKFMRKWNQDVSKENFYHAYTWHPYAACAACDKEIYFDNVYIKNLSELAPQKNNYLYNLSKNFINIYGNNRKLWLTEWNISNTDFLNNTFVQAAYVSENFLTMIDLNTKSDNYIELTNLHAIEGLISTQKGKQNPVLANGDDIASTQYFAFKFLASTLTDDVYKADQTITCSDTSVSKNFVCNAFLRKSDNKVFLHFINRSGKNVKLEINAKSATAYQINSIDADYPYATAGKTEYEKEYPNKVKPVRYREEKFTKNTVTVAPYSLGCISYNM